MKCESPLILKRALTPGEYIPGEYATEAVPCYKCYECRKQRAHGWVIRLKEELRISQSAVFATLTYADEHIKWTPMGLATLDYKDWRLFTVNLRKKAAIKGIKMYAVSEYGTESQRPHWHAIIFNLPQDLIRKKWSEEHQIWHNPQIDLIWKQGHVDLQDVTTGRLSYVAGYCMKKLEDQDYEYLNTETGEVGDDRLKEKTYISKGIGKSMMLNEDGTLTKKGKFYRYNLARYLKLEGGKYATMPKYYRDKIFTEKEKAIFKTVDRLRMETPDKEVTKESELMRIEVHKANKLKNEKHQKQQRNGI